jgi:hypothetical protein
MLRAQEAGRRDGYAAAAPWLRALQEGDSVINPKRVESVGSGQNGGALVQYRRSVFSLAWSAYAFGDSPEDLQLGICLFSEMPGLSLAIFELLNDVERFCASGTQLTEAV